ncbi:MAG: cysteine--tRNA ligase [Ardenticatenia bacterium]|nr:cysteine--tRNA ligase [Ardenticatenia bacterium]
MKLYNSLTGRKEPFHTFGPTVTLYVCGITPYDTTHLGHAFTYVTFDVLVRFLESRGHTVRYVQNVTDIDDDILRKAREVGKAWDDLGREQTEAFVRDMSALNVRPPDFYPRATWVIPYIIKITQILLERGFAYERAGNVYYRVHADPAFGQLSKLDYGDMLRIANERGNNPNDPHKDDPLDFVLWQAAQPGEPTWESPWGPGRPGWHIECSAMGLKYLGATIDIHGGGGDLLFPHHECEIAQSEKFTGQRPFVRWWVHIAMVRKDGEKMSKSLGNLVLVRDLLNAGFSPDAIRLNLLRHHYRHPWEWDEEEQVEAQAWADELAAALRVQGGEETPLDPHPFRQAFDAALADDLDTPRALAHLRRLAAAIARAGEEGRDVRQAHRALRELGHKLGLSFGTPPVVGEEWTRLLTTGARHRAGMP